MLATLAKEFDSGHFLPGYDGPCANVHGHRYRLEVTVERKFLDHQFMVADFTLLKQIVEREVVSQWDHKLLVAEGSALEAMLASEDYKCFDMVRLPGWPTAENMVFVAFGKINRAIEALNQSAIMLHSLRLYETPNCWVDLNHVDFATMEGSRNVSAHKKKE